MKTTLLVVLLLLSAPSYATTPSDSAKASAPQSDSAKARQVRYAHIIDSLNSVLRSHPNDDSAHQKLADAYYDIGKWPESANEYEVVLARSPHNIYARVDYAYVLVNLTGDFQKPIEQIKLALVDDPDNVRALINLSILIIQSNPSDRRGSCAKAFPYLETAYAAAVNKGDTASATIVQKMIDEVKKTLAWTPADSARAAQARYKQAADSLNLYLPSHPDDTSAHLQLANTYYDMEKWAEAAKEYEIVLAKMPGNNDVRVDYAMALYQSTKSYDKPLAELKIAIANDPF
ncbi:MAG: tetratricopeptide repeat protein, partial [Bacteroidota bacterium]|nr:tetratricopeptide repeat protein [Bacteroidota bacterium]